MEARGVPLTLQIDEGPRLERGVPIAPPVLLSYAA
jgi:hypothetical protein